jgi:DNA-binding CsgD family transcriptional regulator
MRKRSPNAPMSAERREFLLAAAARHAARFDDVAHRRRRGSGLRTSPLRPRPVAQEAHRPSPRKVEVLKLMADGHTNVAIANLLDISEETVKTHVKSLAHILGSKNRTHTVALAFRNGLLMLDPQAEPEP